MHSETADRGLASRLARLLRFGTTIAVTVTSIGMLAAHTSFTGVATAAVVSGLLMFALLPIAGLLAAVQHYVQRLDWTYVALTVGVLVLVGANFLVGSAS
ncbi:hypothetical protein A6I85_19155 [Prescottella equi]|nr:hypothetical protein A6I85_19155 [Prescottella equi]ORM01313.1 hypothetical protein A5N72_19250 [Prescottella equi]